MTHQSSFSQAEFAAKKKTTRREKFRARMEEVIPWAKHPESGMAGFAAESAAEPGSTLAGFEPAKRKWRPTVSRWIASSRAVRRCDQPCAAKVVMECCRLTLS